MTAQAEVPPRGSRSDPGPHGHAAPAKSPAEERR